MPLNIANLHAATACTCICMQEDFDAAAERIKPVTGPNNDEMLELYGLFKQATVGDNNTRKLSTPLMLSGPQRLPDAGKTAPASNARNSACMSCADFILQTIKIVCRMSLSVCCCS